MTSIGLRDHKAAIADHLEVLGEYAARVVRWGGKLDATEQADRSRRLEELFAVGRSFGLTEREMVVQVFGDVTGMPRELRCECPTCRRTAPATVQRFTLSDLPDQD